MTRHFDYRPSAIEADNLSEGSSVLDQWLAGGYDLEIGHFWKWLAWWIVAFLRSVYYLG